MYSFSGYVGFGGGGSLTGFVRALCNRVNNKVKLAKVIVNINTI